MEVLPPEQAPWVVALQVGMAGLLEKLQGVGYKLHQSAGMLLSVQDAP